MVPVKCSGPRSGSGPFALGPQNLLRWAVDQAIFGAVQCQTLNVAPGHSPNDLTRAIGRLISRPESLRTLFAVGESGGPTQQVSVPSELLIDVHGPDVSCPTFKQVL